eukprot:518495-Pelagomonas_calceolata.AAC.2
MTFFSYKDSKSLVRTQFGGLAGQMWAAGCQQVGFTPWLIRHVSLQPCWTTRSMETGLLIAGFPLQGLTYGGHKSGAFYF